jgi:hypothetical protein
VKGKVSYWNLWKHNEKMWREAGQKTRFSSEEKRLLV